MSTRDRSIAGVLRRPPRRAHDYRHVTRSQSATIYRADGSLAVDRLLRFEHLDQDFAKRFADDIERLGYTF